jgi:hypothetical protein
MLVTEFPTAKLNMSLIIVKDVYVYVDEVNKDTGFNSAAVGKHA